MGVDIETWCAVLKRNPLRFKFEGLDGYHTDVRKAAVVDETFMGRWMEGQHKYVAENILEFLELYIDFLRHQVNLLTCHVGLVGLCRDPVYTEYTMRTLEDEVGDMRYEFACAYSDPQVEWESIRDGEPDHLLKDHPPEMLWNEAYGGGFPVENVVYLCPSCSRQGMTTDELNDNGHHHYCSLCGSEYLESHDFADPEDLEKFIDTMGLQLWPFGMNRVFPTGSRVWWCDPDDATCSGWKTVTGRKENNLILDEGTEASIHECIPEGML